MKNISQEATKAVELYKGEEDQKHSEEEYGVCSECGTELGKHDVGFAHSVCEQSMVLGNNELFY